VFNSIQTQLTYLYIFVFFFVPQGVLKNVEYEVRYNVCVYYIMFATSPSTETNGQIFLRRPGPTRGCRTNDDDDNAKPIQFYFLPNLRQVNKLSKF